MTWDVTGNYTYFDIKKGGSAGYISSIVVTYSSSTTSYISVPNCCSDPGLAYGTGSVTKTYGAAAFTNTLTNSHSVAVTYASSDPTVATVDGAGQVTILKAGTTTITASSVAQTVAAISYCADEASYTLTVNKADITPTLTYTPNSVAVGENSAAPSVGGNPGSGTVTYAITSATPAGCATINAGTGVVTGAAVGSVTVTATVVATTNYNGGTATANVTIHAASYFTNGATVFIQAESSSAWDASACVKAWFNASGAGGAAQTTYWLFDATGGDAGKKLFATIVPATGDLNQVTLQRFASNCSDFWNANGTLTKSSDGGSNTFRTTGSGTANVAWNGSGITLDLYGDPDSWTNSLGTLADQGNGVWTATYNNYAPADAEGESQEFKIQTNYNGWIGNTGSNDNATLDGMHIGSTYNITATLDVKDHSLVMSKTFVKGTVHFDLQGHGSAIADLTNVTAGSKISAPAAPSATGYDFGGWYKEAGCTNAWNFASDEVTETMTLYAKWTAQTYTITSTLDNATASPAIPASYTYTGSAANLSYTISATSGYRLPADITVSGTTYTWNAGTGALVLTGTITGNVTITITAVQTHTVTWLSNGENYVSPVVYDHGATLALPAGTPSAPTSCSEKEFIGWTSDSEITSETSTEPTLITAGGAVNTDATYRAVFADVTGSPISWTQVTSVSIGDEVVIAEIDDDSKELTGFYTTITTANNYGTGTAFTTTPSATMVWTVEAGNSAGQFSFKNGDYYLNLASNNNYLNGSETKNANSSWTITTSSSRAKITNASQTARSIMYKTSGRFASYNKSHGDYEGGDHTYYYYVILYKKTGGVSYDNYITQCCSLKPVTSLVVSGTTANSVTLSWTAPSPTTGIDHLELRNASTHAKVGSDIAVGTTTVTVSELVECTEYSYYIASVGAACETASATVNARPYSGSKTVNYVYHDGATANSQFTTDCDNPTITLPTPTWALHTFQGWYDAATGGNKLGDGGATYNPATSPVTLHAQWTETEFLLTQTIGSHTTKGHVGTSIKTSDIASNDLELTYSISDGAYALPKTVTISGGGIATWVLGTNYTWTLSADKHSATLAILQGQTISANVTVTVTERARYTVTLDEHGSTTTQYYAFDDNSFTWGDIADCGEKLFYGWTTDAVFTEDDDTPPTCVLTKGTETINSTRTYYAIYADAVVPQNPGYEKVTTISAGTYLIATDKGSDDQVYTGKVVNQDYGGCADVSVSTGVISTKPNDAVEVTIEMSGDNFYMYDGTHYLGYSGSSNDMDFDASKQGGNNNLWKINNNSKIESVNVSGRLLQCNTGSNPKRFACYTSSQTVAYLYKKQTTAWSNFTKSCALFNITINNTTPDDGTVTTSPAAGTDAAGEGQTVTVTATPNSCKYLSALSYNDGNDDYDILSTRSFTMPDADVTITATFATKTVSAIAPNTNSHRALMQGSAFEGEQIRVTYNSGETEDLAWDDSRLAFSGCNMSTLGEQTVTVTYTGCGTTSTTYSAEVMDGVPVTYVDAGEETTVKYDVDATVPVESRAGRFALTCDGWEFAGWSETAVADNSTSFAPVRNFNASTARTLYAVYVHIRVNGSSVAEYKSADRVSELREGARYIIAGWVNSNNESYGMTAMLPTVTGTYFLNGTNTGSSGFTYSKVNESGSYRYYSTATLDANAHWQLMADGTGYWQLYNKTAGKYLDLTNFNPANDINTAGYAEISNTPNGKLVMSDYNDPPYDNDSKIHTRHSTSNDTHSLSWDRSNSRFNQYKSATAFYLTKDEYFSSMPPCAPRSVIFHGNGGTVSDGENESSDLVITEANRGDGITTPTAAMDMADCNGNVWQFVGWLDSELARTQIPVLTTDLLNDGGGNKHHTIHADDEEYYAVYSNTGMPETKYGTINLSASDFSSVYPNSLTDLTKEVAGIDSYTFKYIKMGYPAGIGNGIQMHQDEGYIYNETSLGKINSISLSNIREGSVDNLKVYVSNDPEHIDTELTSAVRQLVGNVYTYYPARKYEYVRIAAVGDYVTLDGISIDFGRGSVVYASAPDCTLRVTYKAAGEEDHVVEIGGDDSHDLPAYYPALGCDDKEFIGWAEAGIASLQQTAPTIYTADGSLTGVSASKTLYAVYASRNGGKNLGTTSNMFTETWYRHDWDGTNRIITGSYSAWSTDVNETPYNVFTISDVPYSCVMFNVKNLEHYLVSEQKYQDLHSVAISASSRDGASLSMTVYVSADKSEWTQVGNAKSIRSDGTIVTNTYTLPEATDAYIKIVMPAKTDGSKDRYKLGITSIRPIKANRTYYLTDYSTTCETASAPVALTWAEVAGSTIETGTEPATSVLGNQLVLPTLSKDNYRFDGWKVTIDGDQKADVYAGGETFLINHLVTFTAQWTEMFEVSDPAYGVTSYKDITTTSETFTMTVKGTHSITPVVDGLSDDTHFAVTITTPGTNDGDDTDFTYTFTYTPDAFGTGSGAATHTATFRFKDETSGAVSEEVTIRGRSLPEEFVIAVKNNDKWYALPGDLQHTSAQPAIVPVEIMVNDNTTPTVALLAPQTAVYKAANRYTPANTTALRFTVTGSNWLQVSGIEGTYNMWLSNTGGNGVQDWQLHSADFNAYELTIPSNAYPTKKMGIYNGSYMGYHTSPSHSQIYLLPVDAEYTPREAKVKEWGRYAVVVEVATADIATVKAHIDNAAPTSSLTPQPVNVATIAGAKNLLVNTVDAIDFSAQEGHSLYLDWYNSSSELIATSQISVPLIIAENKTMSSIDAVKTHWEKKEVHVLPGAKLTADANTYASGNVAVKTLEVYPNATLHVSAGTLNTTDLNLRCGWTRANGKDYDVARVFIDPSAALAKTHAAMQYDIFDSEEGKHYYPLAVPFSTPVSTIDYADDYLAGFSTYGTHYVIKDYDGALRAENGVIDENWRVIASDGTLQPGRGYIITAVAVKGEALIRIPLSFDNAWTSAGEKATVDAVTKNVVPVVAHTGSASAGESANNRRHAGWNILGVPFMSCYTAGTDMYATDALIKGNIVIVGGSEGFAYQNTSVPYVSVPTHNFAEYIQTDITDAKLLPGWSFFVQVGTSGDLTFSVAKQREDSDTPLYAPQRTDKEHLTVRAALVLAGNGSTDKTTLIISDHYEAATYEIGADLEKMFGNGYTLATYTVMEDGTRLVFNALAIGDVANSVPVGFRAPDAGEYTFALDDTYPTDRFERLDLIDYKEGTLTNLLGNSYTFTTDRTQDDTRFALNVVLRLEPKIPTATNDVTGTGSKVEKRIVDGCLTIIRNGMIYDATGKLKVTTAE